MSLSCLYIYRYIGLRDSNPETDTISHAHIYNPSYRNMLFWVYSVVPCLLHFIHSRGHLYQRVMVGDEHRSILQLFAIPVGITIKTQHYKIIFNEGEIQMRNFENFTKNWKLMP